MTSVPSQPADISIPQLRADLTGEVIAPDDSTYDEARTVFLTGIDRRPAVITRVADATDASRVVSLARGRGLEVRFYAQIKVRDGKVAYIYDHEEKGAALEAAGLKE